MEKNSKLTNWLQGIIITLLTGFGIMFWATRSELKAEIKTVQNGLSEIKVNQAIIRTVQQQVLKDLEQNEREHREIKELIQ